MRWGLNSQSGYSATYWWFTAVAAAVAGVALAIHRAWGWAIFALVFALGTAGAGYRAWRFGNKT